MQNRFEHVCRFSPRMLPHGRTPTYTHTHTHTRLTITRAHTRTRTQTHTRTRMGARKINSLAYSPPGISDWSSSRSRSEEVKLNGIWVGEGVRVLLLVCVVAGSPRQRSNLNDCGNMSLATHTNTCVSSERTPNSPSVTLYWTLSRAVGWIRNSIHLKLRSLCCQCRSRASEPKLGKHLATKAEPKICASSCLDLPRNRHSPCC